MSRVVLRLPIDLAERDVLVSGDWPLSEAEWTQVIQALDAMRPALVVERRFPSCRHGHEQSPENVYGKAGGKRCRLCNREYQRRFDLRKYGHRRPHRGDVR